MFSLFDKFPSLTFTGQGRDVFIGIFASFSYNFIPYIRYILSLWMFFKEKLANIVFFNLICNSIKQIILNILTFI